MRGDYLVRNSLIWSNVLLSGGTVLWLYVTTTAVLTGDYTGVQRAGTILICAGVVSLIIARRFADEAQEAIGEYLAVRRTHANLLSAPEKLQEPFTEVQKATLLTIESFLNDGSYLRFRKWRQGLAVWEFFTIALGTFLTGYGDMAAQLLLGSSN